MTVGTLSPPVRVLLVAALALGVLGILPSSAGAVTVTIDGLTRYQTIDGFGSSERVFDDPHVFDNFNPATGRALTTMTTAQQDDVLDRLYGELGLTRVRAASPDDGGIEPVNDNADPNVTDLSKLDFSWKSLDAHCDYFARARQRGASTSYLSPLTREGWMGVSSQSDVAEYAEWMLAQVERCAARGVRLPYLSVANEPSASWAYNPMSGAFIRDVIKTLGPRLRAAGFATMFVVPDDVLPSYAAAAASTVLSDAGARPYVGAIATHLYGEPLSAVGAVKQVADTYNLPLWMTEFFQDALPEGGLPADPFTWASVMHKLIATYGFSAIDYMWGYFGDWRGNEMLVRLNLSQGAYTGYSMEKVYYTMGQFSRFVRPGAVRIKAEQPSGSPAKVSAYLKDGTLTVVAINDSDSSQALTFDLAGVPAGDRVTAVRTSQTESWVGLSPTSVQGSTFDAVLPARSITTLVHAPRAVPPTPVLPSNSVPPPTGIPGARRLADREPPVLSALRLGRRRFRIGPGLPRAATARIGSTLSFRLSEPAAVRLRFRRSLPGRRVGGRCIPSRARRNAPSRRCTRLVEVRGSIPVTGRAGINGLRFAGRLTPRRSLRPGRYRISAVATDRAGNRSASRGAGFVLLPGR